MTKSSLWSWELRWSREMQVSMIVMTRSAPKLESTRSADDGEDNSLRSHDARVVVSCRTHSSTTVATTGASTNKWWWHAASNIRAKKP